MQVSQKPYDEKGRFTPLAPSYGKLGKKTFGIRLPEDVSKCLESLPPSKRIDIMRNSITQVVRQRYLQDMGSPD